MGHHMSEVVAEKILKITCGMHILTTLSLSLGEIGIFYDYFCYSCDKLLTENPQSAIVAAGDFNCASNGFQIKSITSQCNLKQIMKEPTRKNSIPNLIFTNLHGFYDKPKILDPIGTSDHHVIEWKSKISLKKKNVIKKVR